MDGWDNFFVATAGASVAFAGLVLVSVSINLQRIVAQPGLVGRSAGPLIVLFVLFVTSIVVLIPGQRLQLYGFELLLVATTAALLLVKMLRQQRQFAVQATRDGFAPGNSFRYRAALCGVVIASLTIAGALLAINREKGMYFLAPAMVTGFLFAFLESWVLLIEIDR